VLHAVLVTAAWQTTQIQISVILFPFFLIGTEWLSQKSDF